MDIDDFIKIKPALTAALASALEAKLIEMGEDAKGISWFSSIAEVYNSKGSSDGRALA